MNVQCTRCNKEEPIENEIVGEHIIWLCGDCCEEFAKRMMESIVKEDTPDIFQFAYGRSRKDDERILVAFSTLSRINYISTKFVDEADVSVKIDPKGNVNGGESNDT